MKATADFAPLGFESWSFRRLASDLTFIEQLTSSLPGQLELTIRDDEIGQVVLSGMGAGTPCEVSFIDAR